MQAEPLPGDVWGVPGEPGGWRYWVIDNEGDMAFFMFQKECPFYTNQADWLHWLADTGAQLITRRVEK